MKILNQEQKQNLEKLLSYANVRVSLAQYPYGDKRAIYMNGYLREYTPEETLVTIAERYEKHGNAALSTLEENNV